MSTFDVTIVVCTYNRAEMLRGALESLVALKTEGQFAYEVVVVDNASTDATSAAIAAVAGKAAVPVRYVYEARSGVAAARNRGIAEARSDWIAFFDDDQLADPSWLAELRDAANRTGALLVGGPYQYVFPADCPPHLVQAYSRFLGHDPQELSPSPPRIGTGNMLVHRSVFAQVGPFDESLREAGEDTDMYRRVRQAGIAAWYAPKAIIHHLMPLERLLDAERLRRNVLRTGWAFARRDCRRWGRAALLPLATARFGQALCVALPRLLAAHVRRDAARHLIARWRLWMTYGYSRAALHFLVPAVFPQQDFLGQLDFRNDRDKQ